jgi:hypothetical protein
MHGTNHDVAGFPCAHRSLKYSFSVPGLTWRHLHKEYVKACTASNRRSMAYTTFLNYRQGHAPHLRLKQPTEDECDTCCAFRTVLKDKSSTEEEKIAATKGLSTHIDFAKEHRRCMQLMKLYISERSTEFIEGVAMNHGLLLDFIPEFNDENVDDVFKRIDLPSISKPVLLEMQDFGGNLTQPCYAFLRPSIDYYTSNLLLHMFVVADCTNAINKVYLYDERAMGKGADALCSLRWFRYHTLLLSYKEKGIMSEFPKYLFIVMDNNVGQNKSKAVMSFFALLSILFPFKRIVLLYLVSGHSHMAPDRVVSWVKASLKQVGQVDADVDDGNLYLPSHFVTKMNAVKSVEAEYLDFKDPNRPLYCEWKSCMNEFLRNIPDGLKYTSNHLFEFCDGKVMMKASISSENIVEHHFCSYDSLPVVRRGLLNKIIGTGLTLEQSSPYLLHLPRHPELALGKLVSTYDNFN